MAFALLKLLRLKQWTKGLLVFAAPLFTGQLLNLCSINRTLIALVAIGLMSSSVYVLNDWLDVERDRRHPTKRNRPLAAGTVPKALAAGVGATCWVASIALTVQLGIPALSIVLTYAALQAMYNLRLKFVPVADVFVLASGFVLRAALGAAAIKVGISGWLLICTAELALLVGIGKRRSEFLLQEREGLQTREVLQGYTIGALDAMLVISGASAVMSFGVYSLESATAHRYPAIILAAIWVFYGTYRYIYLVIAKGEGGEPESLIFQDSHMLVCLVLFVASAVIAISGVRFPILEVPQ